MVEFTKEFYCFFVRLPFRLYFRLRPATKSINTVSGAPRPKSAPRGSKSTTFAQGKFQVSNPQTMVANPILRGTLRFTISISDILMAPSCSLRSFLEVGVSWAASRYSFRNLRFKHRGLQLGMWWYTSRINPHPQPPYQASAWSIDYFLWTPLSAVIPQTVACNMGS